MPNSGEVSPASAVDPRRWAVLLVVCLAMLMNALDSSIVNVALPAIQRSLHFTQANLTWVVDAYLITYGSCLLLAGRLGDLIGRKRVFLAGISIFTVSSGVCAAAPDQGTLIAARFVQGMGGAVSSAAIFAIIVTEFPAGVERAKAMSYYILVAVGGSSLGLVLGGALTQSVNWHWIFLINLPVGVATFVVGSRLITENEVPGGRQRVDVAGSVLVTVALMLAIYAIIEAASYGWGSARTLGAGGLAVVMVGGFGVLESRLANPIMPLRILRVRTLSYSSVIRGFAVTGVISVSFLGALDLEHVQGYSPLHTGLAFLPMTLATAVLSCGLTALLVHRYGPMLILLVGMGSMVVGLVLLALAGQHASFWPDLFPAFTLMGVGGGTAFLPLLTIAMVDIPAAEAGLGSGIVNVSMQVSGAIGLAVLSTIAADRSATLGRLHHGHVAALVGGYDRAFGTAAAIISIGMVLAFVLLRGPSRQMLRRAELTVVVGTAAASDALDDGLPVGITPDV